MTTVFTSPTVLVRVAVREPFASVMPVAVLSSSRALLQASKMAGETDAAVVLPPLPPEGGNRVSPRRTLI